MTSSMVNRDNTDKIIQSYTIGSNNHNFLPSVFVVEPISFCNLSCVMCPNSKLSANNLGQMTMHNFKNIITQISPFSDLTMLYFMGEPLQHDEISEMIKIAKENLKGRLVISTNCMLLTSDMAEILVENSVDIIICCIDHWDKEKYEKIRIGGNFESVVKNVERLLEIKNTHNKDIKVIVKSLDFGFKKTEREEFEKHWTDLGAFPLIGWVDTWAGQLPGLRKINYQLQPYFNQQRTHCADLWFKMVINWRGDVVLCCHNFDYSIVIGNINCNSILEIWNNEQIRNLRADHFNGKFNCNSLCENCTEWGTLEEMKVYSELNNDQLGLIF